VKTINDIDFGDYLIQRYLPGIDPAALSDEEWAIKVRTIQQQLKNENGFKH
jgi:hypothetical protein